MPIRAFTPSRTGPAITIIVALWALACLPGLSAVGLVNWQESARALAAQQMQQRGDWIVPTIAGKPYLAKPPMLYWCELTLCALTGQPASEAALRFTVALAGLAGALLTYFAARSILAAGIDHADPDSPSHATPDPLQPLAALWSAVFLTTGVLYVRSSRIGELDILLAPFTVLSVWGTLWAWTHPHAPLTRRALAIFAASLAAAAAALTKGPPALIPLTLALAGGITLHTAWSHAPRPSRRALVFTAVLGSLSLASLSLAFNREQLTSSKTILGALLLAACGATLSLFTPLFTSPRKLLPALRAIWSSGLLISLCSGLAALWLWTSAVQRRLGPDVIAATAQQEAADNLRAFSPESPIQNFEALTYAAGIGSLACLAALVWLLTKPPRISRPWWVLISWLTLGMIVFSLAGRGTGRYLTPLWPAVALLGGLWITRAARDLSWGRALSRAAALALLILAAAQSFYYTIQRPKAEGPRSPREFLHELLQPQHNVDAARLAAIDFWVGSLDFYANHHVEPVTDIGPWIDYPHDETPIDAFVARLRATGETYTVLVRAQPSDDPNRPAADAAASPPDHLRSRGLTLEEIPLTAPFRIDRQTTPVKAFRARATTPRAPSPG